MLIGEGVVEFIIKSNNNSMKSRNAFFTCLMLAFVSSVYVGWQLWGLRYTNHDDIFFNLAAWIFSDNYFDFANQVAQTHGRLPAFINMPVVLGVDRLGESYIYDIVNIGFFLSIYIALAWLLSKFGPICNAVSLVAIALILFPLHYYFTFPQGYPVMAAWEVSFVLLAAIFLIEHIQDKSRWRIATSVILFFCSLWGAEYNLVLHPFLMLTPLLFMYDNQKFVNYNLKSFCYRLLGIYWPYIIAIGVFVFAYEVYSDVVHHISTEKASRLKPNLEFNDWFNTLAILEAKAFLPISLWFGIKLTAAVSQGVPDISSVLNYTSIFNGFYDRKSLLIFFILAWVFCSLALHIHKFNLKVIRNYSIILIIFALVPFSVLSVSSLYQNNVREGWTQGHLATFYAQLGMAGLFFLLFSILSNLSSSLLFRTISIQVGALVLAGVITMTFVYNNANRQVMSANSQKWFAMRELVDYIRIERPDLGKRIFFAPSFWTYSGVSNIPKEQEFVKEFGGDNYWTKYIGSVLKYKLMVKNDVYEANQDSVFVTYFSTPLGAPLLVLYERNNKDDGGLISLISSRPLLGSLYYDYINGSLIQKDMVDWNCQRVCLKRWHSSQPIQTESLSFASHDHGPSSMLSQFFLGRGGSYGIPLLNTNELKVVDWGPQTSSLGLLPNIQPNGQVGIWIKLKNELHEDTRIYLDGMPGTSIGIQGNLLTAGFSAENFKTEGKKVLIIKTASTGKVLIVGNHVVEPDH